MYGSNADGEREWQCAEDWGASDVRFGGFSEEFKVLWRLAIMNKKKQVKSTRGRGVGRLKTTPRIPKRKVKPLQERDLQENKTIVCTNEKVVKGPPKKAPSRRGRPRGRTAARDPLVAAISEKLLLPAPQRHVDMCNIVPVTPVPRCAVVPTVQYPMLKFRAQSMSIVLSKNPSQERSNTVYSDNNRWPEDLEQLVMEWDQLPQGHLWEVIKWLSAPVEALAPHMVTYIQQMLAEWEDTIENKDQQILSWLGYDTTSAHQETATPPKVVVEMESTSVQVCSQWSSMVDLTESRQP